MKVQFGNTLWENIEISEGERTILTPGIVKITNASLRGNEMRTYPIFDAANVKVGDLSLAHPTMPLPPGRYVIDVLGRQQAIDVKSGETIALRVQ